ncbi:MAG: GMC family oxidoreductase [Sorangiineae bacterium]|nr:GMC family oxidoreductase [Polyangiaceae bacterium]MEB2323045.1 GMC family oxidoreductase [Sorangiineae bacterium]
MTRSAADVVVIGSGAGGAVTALELARAGVDVLVIEEGERHSLEDYGASPPEAMRRLYRRTGMTPITGRVPIGYVEGRCLGGSTEINSGFWHRTPREVLARWSARYQLLGASEEALEPHFSWAERMLGVGPWGREWPMSTRVFARGIEKMGWSYQEVPRAAPGCQGTNACAQGCPTGAKQGMSRSVLAEAERLGARVLTGARVEQVLVRRGRATGLIVALDGSHGSERLTRVDAEHVFVCGGPTETPSLLYRSGVKYHVGSTLRIHPYLKVAARFDEELDADLSVLPLVQVKEFAPELTLGGGFFTPGQLAMTLSENGREGLSRMRDLRRMALYYVGVRGTGTGSVRPSLVGRDGTVIRYDVSDEDVKYLSIGLARLAEALLAGGAREVIPTVYGLPPLTREVDAARWLDEALPASALSLVTVHAFSSCPIGEARALTAADSFGRLHEFENLYVNDASMLPDSPGVNPQGSIMAFARRNVLEFLDRRGAGRRPEEVRP